MPSNYREILSDYINNKVSEKVPDSALGFIRHDGVVALGDGPENNAVEAHVE